MVSSPFQMCLGALEIPLEVEGATGSRFRDRDPEEYDAFGRGLEWARGQDPFLAYDKPIII